MKTESQKFTDAVKHVKDYFEDTLNKGKCAINYWYAPHGRALKHLIKREVVKEIFIGECFIGYEYKEHLILRERGTGDCEEYYILKGKV